MLTFHVKFVQTGRWPDRQTDRLTTVKQHAPDLLIWGHKNIVDKDVSLASKKYIFHGNLTLSTKFGKKINATTEITCLLLNL